MHSTKYFDHYWLVETVQDMAKDLLERGYKYVLFAEIDELVVADPVLYPSGLSEYIKRLSKPAVRVTCYDIRHNVSLESKLDLRKPILQQRRFWMRHTFYDKPPLTNMALHWTTGFHSSQEQVDQ